MFLFLLRFVKINIKALHAGVRKSPIVSNQIFEKIGLDIFVCVCRKTFFFPRVSSFLFISVSESCWSYVPMQMIIDSTHSMDGKHKKGESKSQVKYFPHHLGSFF